MEVLVVVKKKEKLLESNIELLESGDHIIMNESQLFFQLCLIIKTIDPSLSHAEPALREFWPNWHCTDISLCLVTKKALWK